MANDKEFATWRWRLRVPLVTGLVSVPLVTGLESVPLVTGLESVPLVTGPGPLWNEIVRPVGRKAAGKGPESSKGGRIP